MHKTILLAGLVLAAGLIGFQVSATDRPAVESKHAPTDPELAVATFAGGCFWCVEAAYEKIPGVVETVSGYSGGSEVDPTYRQVSAGRTGHTEAVQVYYDPTVITYQGLLQGLWRMMDPTDRNGQFVDRGPHYRPAIFFHDARQRELAEESKQALAESGRYDDPVVIEITPFETFYEAEDYHQDYYKKNPIRYKVYTFNSGRYQFIDKVWGEDRQIDYARFRPAADQSSETVPASPPQPMAAIDPVQRFDPHSFRKPGLAELQQRLTPIQFQVTQEDATERAFDNPYWDEKRAGLYVDVVSGEPLFASTDKYRSGTGWPSFVRPIHPDAVVTREDRAWFGVRTEVRSALADSHLGHVFADGPAPTGLRYCMNSAALRFIPRDEMAAAGYAAYLDAVKPPARV